MKKFRYKNLSIAQVALVWIGFCILLFMLSFWLKSTKPGQSQLSVEPATKQILNNDFTADIYFNGTPETSVLPVLREAIDKAIRSVTMVMYSYNDPQLQLALLNAADRGVDVTLILDRTNHEDHRWLLDSPQPFSIVEVGDTREDYGYYMHHKFMLIDADTTTPVLFFGAMNFTTVQNDIDPSFVLKTTDIAFIEPFEEEADRLLQGHASRDKFSHNYQPFSRLLSYTNGSVAVWFGPGTSGNSARQPLVNLLQEATTSIDIAAWLITDESIARQLRVLASQGIRVRVLTDDALTWGAGSVWKTIDMSAVSGSSGTFELISDLERTLAADRRRLSGQTVKNPFLHQHFVLVDGTTLITGTNNWSYNGFYSNDESIIETTVPEIVTAFSGWFEQQYRELRGRQLSFSRNGRQVTVDTGSESGTLEIYKESPDYEVVPQPCYQQDVSGTVTFELPEECSWYAPHLLLRSNSGAVIAGTYLY